jgi:hypothetical protein
LTPAAAAECSEAYYRGMDGDERFQRAIALIDTANAADPATITVGEVTGPKELVHSEMLTRWVRELTPKPSEAVLLAARGQHIRRWEHPRSSYPEGRRGYLRWRTGLYAFHAEQTAALLRQAGYDDATLARVSFIIRKQGLGRDSEVQAIEDGLCLVFLETQLGELAGRTDRDKMLEILRKTWRKMSPAAHQHALALTFAPEEHALIRAALAPQG